MATNSKASESQSANALIAAGELRVLLGKLHRRLREESRFGDFTWTQLKVLKRLEQDGPATVTVLAKAEGMRPQSMGEVISVLKNAGLIAGSPDPSDGRQTVLSLTNACRKIVKESRAAREDWLFRTIQTKLSATEQEKLGEAVELLKRLLDD